MQLKAEALERYLSQVFDRKVSIRRLQPLGVSVREADALKAYGYGIPLRIDFELDGRSRSVVINTIKPGGFGHERMADRAAILLWQAEAFNKLPRHVKALDIGAFTKDGSALSLSECEEFFLLTDLVEGREYFHDLDRIRDSGELTKLDLERCEALARYLVEIHSIKRNEPDMYRRRIRELIGHSECIFGLTDSYPEEAEYIKAEELIEIEKRCIEWRWRLKHKAHRLSQVHGDFHPWNVLFREDVDFTLLDRSRGEWGEPADDVSAMTINYLFYSLQRSGDLRGPFKKLWETFYRVYLDGTGDEELLEVIQPFYCWRALVIASPVWYPTLSLKVRRGLLNFARNILEVDVLNPWDINPLLEEP